MAEVRDLRGNTVPLPAPKPVEVVVSCLEALLEDARAGKIYGLAMVVADYESLAYYRLSGYPSSMEVLGALTAMSALISNDINAASTEED